MGPVEKPIYRLSDGRPMRAMEGSVTPRQMFALFGRFDPYVECVATVKDVGDAIHTSKIYAAVMGNGAWVRTAGYGFFHRNPEAPLGKELLWIENETVYKKIIPDVPVLFRGNEISLQKVVGGTGIYPSINLLKIEQTDEREFTVSPVSLDVVAGKVRAMNFMKYGWALPDIYGFPDGDKPSSYGCAMPNIHAFPGGNKPHPVPSRAARYGSIETDFHKKATGWHGSFSCSDGGQFGFNYWGRGVIAGNWSGGFRVALVNRPETDLQLTRNPTELIIRGTSKQLDAAVRLLQLLKE